MTDGQRHLDLERIAGLRRGLLDNPPGGWYEDDPRWREIAELQARVELAPRGPEVLTGWRTRWSWTGRGGGAGAALRRPAP